MKKRLGLNNTAFWIILLLVLLVAFNVIAFFIYQAANPEGTLSVQLWNYLESAIFKVITASLILPIILFFLENRFKVVENMRQDRRLKERKEKEELKEERWECIEQTTKIWNQLWDLTSEVIYFKKDANKEPTIENLLIRLRSFTPSAEDVTNTWSHRFPNLPPEYEEAFTMFFNTELDSTETVAWCIRQANDGSDTEKEEIIKLQDSLKRIVESINFLTHHSLINVLKRSMELLELKEANKSEDRQQDIVLEIDEATKDLKEWANAISRQDYKHNKPFSFIDNPDVKDFRKEYQKLSEWMLKNPGKDPTTSRGYKKEYANFEHLFYKIPHEKTGPWYSKVFIKHLANWISLECERAKLLYWAVEQQPSE